MSDLIILHTNDIHGRIEGLARIATLVQQIRAENPETPVLYFDGGDSEESSVRLSNLTKGQAMHRLLSLAGCDAASVGNAALVRYGPQVLAEHAEIANYPLLLANVRLPNGNPPVGVETRRILTANDTVIGLIGITAKLRSYQDFFNLDMPDTRHIVRDLAASLAQDGVDMVILLSHLGLQEDAQLAVKLQDIVGLIIGAHTHDLLPEGKLVGNVMVVQAGQYAEHLGRVDLVWNDDDELVVKSATVIPINENISPSQAILDEVKIIEGEVETFLDQPIGTLATSLEFAPDQECGVGNLMADALRHVMQAEVGLSVVGAGFTGALFGGTLKRLDLWDVCNSTGNPGIVSMSGQQLLTMINKGLDKEFAADSSVRALRGRARGYMHLSGASVHDGQVWIGTEPLNPVATYRVAGSDFELESTFGYALEEWQLKPTYKIPTILREAVELYLADIEKPVSVTMNRIQDELKS